MNKKTSGYRLWGDGNSKRKNCHLRSSFTNNLLAFLFLFTITHNLSPATSLYAATIPSDSCSRTHVQSAIDRAQDGDTVFVPAGTCTWTTSVNIPDTKAIILQGTGIGQTVIRDGQFGLRTQMLDITVSPSRLTRVTGFTFDANGQNQTDKQTNSDRFILIRGDGLDTFRVDHNEFINLRYRGVLIAQEGNELSGLIDHNTFDAPFDSGVQSVSVIGNGPQTNAHMARPYEPGSNKFIFMEDNILNYAFPNDGGLEGYGGARYVMRFNTYHGGAQGHHGADSGNYRGTHSFEIYGNNFTTNLTNIRAHQFRSGTGFVFNNTYSTGHDPLKFHFDNYRSRGTYGAWEDCRDGTHPHDGNTPFTVESAGYPCLDQIGHVFTDTFDHTLTPFYSFLLRREGSQVNFQPITSGNNPVDIVENREFYNENASFNGTTGVGVGPIANRPNTCISGVGYWATDQGDWNSTNGSAPDGQFYKCTSPNTWSLYYEPYTYPHPLATGALTATPPITPSAGLEFVISYPNPWRGDQNTGQDIVFDKLPLNTTIKIFTIAGEHVVTLPSQSGRNTWNLKDKSGDDVASGVYTYVISTEEGDNQRGQIAVVR